MKAITAVCATGASVPAIANGRVQRHRDGENAEIQMYLSKLKDLVPFMPKNKKLSKLDVILNVIDYICDLQTALESHPAVNQFDAQTVLNGLQQQQQQLTNESSSSTSTTSSTSSSSSPSTNNRQPLGVRSSPNQIVASNPVHHHHHHHQQQHHHQNHIISELSSSQQQSSSILTTTDKSSSERC